MKKFIESCKQVFQTAKLIWKNSNNVFGYECPDCCNIFDRATARTRYMTDEKYHKTKFYIQCTCCGRTTPAVESLEKAEDNWNDQWIMTEDKILLKDDND